jgi:hypothetical protein
MAVIISDLRFCEDSWVFGNEYAKNMLMSETLYRNTPCGLGSSKTEVRQYTLNGLDPPVGRHQSMIIPLKIN